MRTNLKSIERIECYLLGKLSNEDKSQFEIEIARDEDLKRQVENQKLVLQAIKRKNIRSDIKKVSKSGGSNFWLKISGVIIIVAIVVFYLVSKSSNQETSTPTVIPKDVIDNYLFNGLKTWATPDIQLFKLNAEEGATIEGKDGTLIIIPNDAFLDKNGNVISGNVDFELVEALTLDDMILYNLTTMADGKTLETGGMFYTNATANGEALTVNPKRPLYIEIPTTEVKEGMMAFKGEVTKEGNINWKNPIPLKKFLVKVDFEQLDFLPKGFEQRVRNEGDSSKFYLESKSKIDSLYYTLDYTYNEVAETTLTATSFSCGIDPLTIKSIRTDEFTNTFIATKEFEDRIKAIHKIKNGEDLVQLYIHNLDTPLWEIDSMIAQRVLGRDKKVFDVFTAQKLTNIKNAKIYQKRLSNFYKKKKAEYRQGVNKIKSELAQKNRQELQLLSDELNKLTKKASAQYDDSVYKKAKAALAQNIPIPNAATSNVYATQWYSFGWANIDRYLKSLDTKNKEVSILANNSFSEVKIYQWLDIIRTLTPLTMNGNKGLSVFPAKGSEGARQMKNTYAIAISRDGDQFSWSNTRYNPYKKDTIAMVLSLISLDELKLKLLAFDQSTSPLVKHLNAAKEYLKDEIEERELREKRKELIKKQEEIREREKFINELRVICFPCEKTKPSEQVFPVKIQDELPEELAF